MVSLAWRHGDFSDPRSSYAFASGHAELVQWLEQRSGVERVMMGPTDGYPMFYSQVDLDRIGPLPQVDDLSRFEAYLATNPVDYLVVSPDLLRARSYLQDFFAADPQAGVFVKRLPAGWTVVFRDPSSAPNYVVVARDRK